ncbi:hypothetical protein HR45_01125 [Shewanella mangrovi]|uniref:ABC transporter permease n=1 Tax=Shewanella mangrovi TaxID=1515746 RepID=A0A094K2X0_9GAMM|nr:FtsX-like permease family protein [Shewanella mangrovi]KFZ39031.1 hypothetical protein HR45_01125 [Shewanella mangrovi]
MFEFGPILRTLWRNKTGALLIIVQAALTLGIVSNAAYVVHDRQQLIERPTGIDEQNLFTLRIAQLSNPKSNYQDVIRDLDEIRRLPGVVDASFGNTSPLSNSGSSSDMTNEENPDKPVSVLTDLFSTDSHGLNTLGLKLVSGRFFNDTDIGFSGSVFGNGADLSGIVLTRTLADALFGKDVDVLGKQLMGSTVIGVVEPAMVSYVAQDYATGVAFIANFVANDSLTYIVRCEPGQLSQLMVKVPKLLQKLDPNRIVRNVRPVTEFKQRSYRRHISMVKMLTVTMILVISVTGLGIVGLTLLWGNQRRRQIGIRRALGASRLAVMRYFLTENLLITAIGVVLGVILSLALNQLMVQHYQMSALPLSYILFSMLAVLLLGLLAALVPAWRSSLVSPALATRSV